MRRPLPLFLLSLVLLLPGFGRAQAQVDAVAVQNRLYEAHGHLELSATAGFLVMPQLVRTLNLNLGVAYNFTETFAVEARGGWAASGLTGLSRSVRDNLMLRDPTLSQDAVVDDLSGMWQLGANAALGLRWSPIYGKLNLVAELPVHFNVYLWAGPGIAQLHRESIVICNAVEGSGAERRCTAPGEDATQRLMGSFAVGMRFYTHQGGALRLELRDLVWKDSYLVDVDRRLAEQGQPTGTPAGSPGLVHSVMADLGYTFIF
ncbi:MAG TPA: outer membrane beta-barrel domain-containing protein [Myxococcaceae bacterium]|nr:outer membrane beta-barrel domain-containing protein [Myxococcaceae bacterium]